MRKYDNMKYLKETKARTSHICSHCGNEILSGEIYWKEHLEDKFLHNLHAKKYCVACYNQYFNVQRTD